MWEINSWGKDAQPNVNFACALDWYHQGLGGPQVWQGLGLEVAGLSLARLVAFGAFSLGRGEARRTVQPKVRREH